MTGFLRGFCCLGVLVGLLACLASESRAAERWQIAESANFRVLNYGDAPIASEITAACEALRGQLLEQWSQAAETSWSPKCDVVLHRTDAGYLAEVGNQGRATLASALVERKHGRITLRRIDVRASHADWLERSLPHELSHVLLADRFPHSPLPRWVDEGAAVLADPPEKRRKHAHDLQQVIARGGQFRLVELLALADYPAAQRWDAFYAQSASLVAYLVERQGTRAFLEFVDKAGQQGYEQALRKVYRQEIHDLERGWLAQ